MSAIGGFGLCVCVCMYTSVFVLILQSTLRAEVTKESVPREGTKEEPMGLCLPFEAVIYVNVCPWLFSHLLYEIFKYNFGDISKPRSNMQHILSAETLAALIASERP